MMVWIGHVVDGEIVLCSSQHLYLSFLSSGKGLTGLKIREALVDFKILYGGGFFNR